MKKTIVYFSSCALDSAGKPDPFMLQELPWMLAHFDRVVLCSYYGVAELTQPRPERVQVIRPTLGELRAKLRAPFAPEFWRELHHLRKDHTLTPMAAAKLLLFTMRGYTLFHWAEAMRRPDENVTYYAFWMSYEAFAAALCKRRHPEARAVARGHAFDVDPERNELNPYLMKRFLARTLDGLYPISEVARAQLLACVEVPAEKLTVLGMGSAGEHADTRLPAPLYTDGVLQVVSCSALIEIKQVPLLIDALAGWQGMPLRWTHIGGGSQEEAVRAHAAWMLNAKANVTYDITGTVEREQVQQLYASHPFDVFVNVSRSEGVPVSIMEAMRAGLPIIAPNVGGIPELVDAQVGRLYDPLGGAQAVREALIWLAKLPQEEAEGLRAASQARWNERCRSDVLLGRLFPQAGKEAKAD
jgi:colanic acid/amylovoran biosynthesis glycosyltransferase